MAAVPAPAPPPVTQDDEYEEEKVPSGSKTVTDIDIQAPVGLEAGLEAI